MKVLVSTRRTQGQRASDFTFAPVGELVFLRLFDCDKDRYDLDGGCGCRRSFTGFDTLKGTTTARVVQVAFSLDRLIELATAPIQRSGLFPGIEEHVAGIYVDEMRSVANCHQTGAVLERRGSRYNARDLGYFEPSPS